MATATHVPLEVYLRSSNEPDAEYVDGEIEQWPAGENDHSAWQNAISFGSAGIQKGGAFVFDRSRAFRSAQLDAGLLT